MTNSVKFPYIKIIIDPRVSISCATIYSPGSNRKYLVLNTLATGILTSQLYVFFDKERHTKTLSYKL